MTIQQPQSQVFIGWVYKLMNMQANGENIFTDEINALLVGTATTCGSRTQNVHTLTSLGGFSNLAELTGTGYSRQKIKGLQWSEGTNDPNFGYFPNINFTFNPVLFGPLDANNGSVAGMLLFFKNDEQPLAYLQFTGPYVTNGGRLQVSQSPGSAGIISANC